MARIVGLLLAAGQGRRFGADKLMQALANGTPVAVAAARALKAACADSIAVLRPEQDALAVLLEAEGLTVVRCAVAHSGMGHSLAAGVAAGGDTDGWVVALADMPCIGVPTLRRVAEAIAGGAALAAPERTVVCFSGDGSLKMNIQEMATAAQEGVNVKIILMNNQSLGLVHQQQNLFYGKRIMASRYERPTDFLKIAEGFGMRAVDLDPSPNPRATLAEALHTPGPCLIHATIDPNEFVYPMVPPGAANSEMIG